MSPRFRAFLLLACVFVAALNAAPALRVVRGACHRYSEPAPLVQRSPAELRQSRRPVEEHLHLVALDGRRASPLRPLP